MLLLLLLALASLGTLVALTNEVKRGEFGGMPAPDGDDGGGPSYTQTHFRFYEDDGGELINPSTPIAAEDTDINRGTGTANRFSYRTQVKETLGTAGANFTESCWAEKNGAAAFEVTTTSSGIRITALTDPDAPAHGDDTIRRLSGSETFITDNDGVNEGQNSPGSSVRPDYAGNDVAEFIFAMYLVDADVSPGDWFDLYTSTPGTSSSTAPDRPPSTVRASTAGSSRRTARSRSPSTALISAVQSTGTSSSTRPSRPHSAAREPSWESS
jgi:hypothetical protein